MKPLNNYFVKESYSWIPLEKNNIKDDFDKLCAIEDALGYLEYYSDETAKNDVLEYIAKTILNIKNFDNVLLAIELYKNFDVEYEVSSFIEEEIDIDEIDIDNISFTKLLNDFKNFMIEYHDIDKKCADKIVSEYKDNIVDELESQLENAN